MSDIKVQLKDDPPVTVPRYDRRRSLNEAGSRFGEAGFGGARERAGSEVDLAYTIDGPEIIFIAELEDKLHAHLSNPWVKRCGKGAKGSFTCTELRKVTGGGALVKV